MKDYYGVLGLTREAGEREIKAAYRRLAKQYHPDVVKGDKKKEDRMYEIQEAYGCLGDPKQREKEGRGRSPRNRQVRCLTWALSSVSLGLRQGREWRLTIQKGRKGRNRKGRLTQMKYLPLFSGKSDDRGWNI